jgi:PAS domain S-box-containing protein
MSRRELDDSTFRAFVDQMKDAAAILDADGRYLYVNAATARLLGRPARELIGELRSEVLPGLETSPIQGAKADVKADGAELFESYHPQSDRWFETTLSRLPEGIALSVTRDVTDRERAVEFREHLVGILGHEIRNPLAAISLSLSVIDGAELDAPRRKSVERIASCVRSLRRLTSDILDLARSRLGNTLPIERRPADLRELCREIIEELRYHGRAIELAVHGDVTGFWDAERISQVLANLLLNAIQYSHPGSAIALDLRGDGDGVRVDVTNLGEPISEALLPRLFDPFRRGPRSHNEGMGLGLYIVRLIVRAHGGEVGVESTAAGTRFRVELPRDEPLDERGPASRSPASGG